MTGKLYDKGHFHGNVGVIFQLHVTECLSALHGQAKIN